MRAAEAEALAGRLLIVGFHGTSVPETVRRWIEQDALGGIILFARNIVSKQQVVALNQHVHALNAEQPSQIIVAIDQEGGRVARIRESYVKQLPPMRDFSEKHSTEQIEAAFVELGSDLRSLGFNVDFAPVLDVDTNPDNPVIGDRAFAARADLVIERALACARGLLRGGVLPCGKHFPGHGDTDLDSHLALPHVKHPWPRIESVELAPFAAFAAANLPMVMTAHVHFDALDPGVPATLSEKWLQDILRDKLRFQGVVVSDDLEMKAVSGLDEPGALAVRMVDAGCDLLLVCSELERAERVRTALSQRIYDDGAFRARAVQSDTRRADMLKRLA